MPHQTQLRVIKRRLTGKEDSARLRELRDILTSLPDYKNGPYADIRKWVSGEIDATRARARVVQRDSIAVKREGAAQVALVGAPNSGKSSLLHALSEVQIKIGNYAFTTLRPVPALVRIGGVLVQLVEIPGLIEGASEGRGGGRVLLGVLRGAGAIVYCQDASAPFDALLNVQEEVALAGIDLPYLIAATKMDEASPAALSRLQARFPERTVVPVSILDDDALERFKEAVWGLTGLLRVYLRRGNAIAAEPLALPRGATAGDVARAVHNDLAARFKAARLSGPSARHDGQQAGKDHHVADGDVVEILA